MKVIKKSGFREEYNLSKVKDALQRTAKSINEEFKESDWKEFKPRMLARLEPIMEGRNEIYFWEIDDCVSDALLRSRFKIICKEYISSRSRTRQDKLNDLGLNQLSMWLLKERYLKKDADGNPIETAKEMMCRVATSIAGAEKIQELKEEYSEKFTTMLCNRDFLCNSPALVSAGTNRKGTFSACFAFKISDSLDSIFQVLKDTAKTFQMGGGVGINISKLRETGAIIKSSNGYSSGPISFLKLFDTMVDTVKAGGFRRGAILSMMHYSHPDIEMFINCKRDTTKLNNMNISVALDKEFFDILSRKEDIDIKSPKDGKLIRKKSPNLLLEEIASRAWNDGEPGVLFLDNVEKDNPTPHLGPIDSCNPCSESFLRNSEACNLGSINLMNHIKDGDIDWDKLAETTKLAIRFLDNMIDASPYPTKDIEIAVKETRKVGLGIMGFADLLINLNIKYSSKEAISMAGKIMGFVQDVADKYSIELGKEKGLYTAYREGCPKRRNAVVTTQQPSGSISLIAGVSPGIEPNFAKEYTRLIGNELVKITNPQKDKSAFETYKDIPLEQHILILAEFQKYIENSCSKTINCPENTTIEDIKNLIIRAHKLGVKGITVFRENSKREPLIKCEECSIDKVNNE